MKDKWEQLLPEILLLGNKETEKEDNYKALEIINKKLQLPGAGSKAVPAYKIYEVHV